MFGTLKKRIIQLKGAPAEVARAAAPRIQEQFRKDATTKRGNVPSYGKLGEVPIMARALPKAIRVTGPDWCITKAEKRQQIDGWVDIVQQEARRALRGER